MEDVTGRPPPARTVRTGLSTLAWSADGTRVTKRINLVVPEEAFGPRSAILGHHGRRPTARTQFAYELRVNQLLARHRPPVRAPRLIGHDRRRAALTFEAVAGEPLGPKYPLDLAEADLRAMVAVARATRSYPHRPRWLRRLPIRSRLWRARGVSLLSDAEHRAIADLVVRRPMRWVFAHGDVTPRNVLRGPAGPVLHRLGMGRPLPRRLRAGLPLVRARRPPGGAPGGRGRGRHRPRRLLALGAAHRAAAPRVAGGAVPGHASRGEGAPGGPGARRSLTRPSTPPRVLRLGPSGAAEGGD